MSHDQPPSLFPDHDPRSDAATPVEEVVGLIEHIRYQSDDGAFVVAQVRPERGEALTIKGAMPGLEQGDRVRVRGRWMQTRYGRQLHVDFFEPVLPVTAEGVARYLSAQLEGIGPTLARRVVDKFGADTVSVLDATPERLREVEGIGKKKLAAITDEWQRRQGQRVALLFLQSHGVTMGMANRLLRHYGSAVTNVVRKEPYRLARDVRGIGFHTADRIAQELGFSPESPERIEAGIRHALFESEASFGHCYLFEEQLAELSANLLNIDLTLAEAGVERMVRQGELVREGTPKGDAVFARRTWLAEVAVAEDVRELLVEPEGPVVDAQGNLVQEAKLVRSIETALSITLAEAQRQAVELALTGKLVVVTGGPGTGKTTLVRVLVEACQRLGWQVRLAAPTGRAAKRLAEATGMESKTIHRLLEFSFQAGGFQRHADNPLESAFYVLDETSMIDIFLMRAFVDALPSTARLALVGDVDQLPSVGPGTVLKDFIDSGAVPVVRLTEVFRQASASLIVRNAHRINQGQMPVLPDVESGEEVEYFAVTAASAAETERLVVEMVCERLPRSFGLDPRRDIQVLSPMRVREAGADAINRLLQERLNPDGFAVGKGDDTLRVGDRVMQLRNDYEKNVYNGDVGWIVRWNPREKELVVTFDDREVTYGVQDLDDLALSYASTVHKAQGSEYPAVVIPLLRTHYRLLQRNLVYTALTRARRLVIVVGDPAAMRIAVRNAQPSMRNTRLAERLRGERIFTSP